MILTNVQDLTRPSQAPCDLHIENGLITKISTAKKSGIADFDAANFWVVPGFVNAHTHVALSCMKSLAPQQPDSIHKFMFPMESNLTEEDIYHFAKLGIAECLLGGCTTIFDHHYFSNAIAKAAEDLGIRAAIAPTILSECGPFSLKEVQKEAQRFFESKHATTIIPMVGPHATDTISKDELKNQIQFAKDKQLPIHIHVSQTQKEYNFIKQSYDCSPIQYLHDLGCFEQPTLLAHAIYLDEGDLNLLKHPKVTLAVCPHSLVLFDQLSPILSFYKANIPIALGTDCAACNDTMDVGKEARAFVTLLRSTQHQSPPAVQADPMRMLHSLTQTPLRLLNQPELCGEIKTGGVADLLFIRKDAINLNPLFNPVWSLVMNVWPENIQHVMVNGEWVVQDRRLVKVDQNSVLKDFHKQLSGLLNRAGIDTKFKK